MSPINTLARHTSADVFAVIMMVATMLATLAVVAAALFVAFRCQQFIFL